MREFNSLLPDQDSLFRSLGNSLKKRSDLTGFDLTRSPGFASKTRNSLYFSLIAGNSLRRGVRPRLRHPPTSHYEPIPGSGVISWLEDETIEQASGRATPLCNRIHR